MTFKIIPVEGSYGIKQLPFPDGLASGFMFGEITSKPPALATKYSVGTKILFKPDGLPLVRTTTQNVFVCPESCIFAVVETTDYL